MSRLVQFRRGAFIAAFCVLAAARLANASATLLLEEPYGKLGWFTATGHAAVYLSGVCAETPLKLRRCQPGELGAVISRYNGVGGYDWVAIPLIPYLYAVDRAEDVPLFADPRLASFLRDQYRRRHLEAVAPDGANGETPGGNWYQLVGSAYDRTSYAFQIETSPERDMDFIRAYNATQNRSHFHTVSSNCADFVRNAIDFYYPKALHRSLVADAGISTPKQMAKSLVNYGSRHGELAFSRFVIPQVPGTQARSTAVHGVVESFFKSKKYMVPSAVVSPIFAGCVAAVYAGTAETGRFDPARRALVFEVGRELESPVGEEDRRSYQLELKHLAAGQETEGDPWEKNFAHMMEQSAPGLDASGRPILRMEVAGELLNVGLSRSNILAENSSREFAQQILQARLREQLRRGNPPKVSASDVEKDWTLLQNALGTSGDTLANRSTRSLTTTSASRDGNRP